MNKRIIAAVVATSALIFVWGTAGAVAYNMYGWFQRSSGGVLSALMWKAGAAQGCPNFPASAPTQYIQPCMHPTPANPSVRDWQDNFSKDPSQAGYNGRYFSAVPNTNGVVTAIVNAGVATWDWDTGTDTLTGTGLLWATSSIGSNPQATQVLSDRITDLVINADGTPTTAVATYGCIEGIFLVTVGTSGCLTVDTAVSGTNSTSRATYNIGADGSCVDREVNFYGAGDTATGNVRSAYDRTAAGSCDDTTGESSANLYAIVQDDGDVLILADLPHNEIEDPDPNDGTDTAALPWPYSLPSQIPNQTCAANPPEWPAVHPCWPAITVSTLGNCIIWGPQSAYNNAYAAGGTFAPYSTAYSAAPVAPCPPDSALRSSSWLVFVRPGATDTDSDGVPNTLDNCTNISNPDQYDSDGDGFGNNCDADLNQSGLVTSGDYTILRTYLNTTRSIPDLSRGVSPTTGLVTASDYTVLRNRLNTIPGPSGRRQGCVSSATCVGPATPGYTAGGNTPVANVY